MSVGSVERPTTTTDSSVASSAAIVGVAAGLLSLNRFGGLAAQAPRAFTRLGLVVVWGWIGLSLMIWMFDAAVGALRPARARFEQIAVDVGRAHLPLAGLAIVLFVAAGALQLRWPGLIASLIVFGWWFPAGLVGAARPDADAPIGRYLVTTLAAYALWVAAVGRHLDHQLGHLV